MATIAGMKPVLYLDQNWASEIAKAENLTEWQSPDREFYGELGVTIRRLVASDRLACPMSEFHLAEASFGTRVKDFLWHAMEDVSSGLRFNHFSEIHNAQVLQAARDFKGLRSNRPPWWRVPFNRDPDLAEIDLPKASPVRVHIPLDEFRAWEKSLRDAAVLDTYKYYKEHRRGQGNGFDEETEFNRKQVFLECYWVPDVATNSPEIDRLAKILGGGAIRARLQQVHGILPNPDELALFMESDRFKDIPFLDVRAAMMAADIVKFPTTIPEPSLNYDFDWVAMALPYSSILATENYVAELIHQAGIGAKCGARVFTMRQKNELLTTLTSL